MKVLVAGSEGSLMQATIPYLLEQGCRVVGVDNFFRYGSVERQRAYEFVEGDLADKELVRALFAKHKFQFVLQAAARIFGVAGFHKYPADILSYDLALHQNLLWEALHSGVSKVIYISSSMVYERCTAVPSREEEADSMPVPSTDYGLSKLVCERLCRAFSRQYGLRFTIWRPFNIISPRERAEAEPGVAHVFADFIQKIVVERQNPVEIYGDGLQTRCFTWIEDVAGAIARNSFRPETDGQTYNLGNPEPVTMQELARRIQQVAIRIGAIPADGAMQFRSRPAYEDDVRLRVPSVEKAARELGWKPTVQLEQALEMCVRSVVEEKGGSR